MRITYVAVGFVAGILAGCSATAEMSEPVVGAIATPTVGSQIVLPLDEYELTTEEDRLNGEAYVLLVERCARRYGEASVELPRPENPAVSNARRYGVFDAAVAREHGYGVPEGTEDRTDWAPTRRELLVLRGPHTGATQAPRSKDDGTALPDGGCTRIAEDQLGALKGRLPDVRAIGLETMRMSAADSRTREAMKNWSRCMADAGYRYSTVWEPNQLKWSDPPVSEELQTALKDVECKREVNLIGVWMTVETSYQQEVIDAHPVEFAALAKWRKERMEAVEKVLAGS